MPNSDIIPRMENLPEKALRDITSDQIVSQLSGSENANKKNTGRLIDSLKSRFSDPVSVESKEFLLWVDGQRVYSRRVIAAAIFSSFKEQLSELSRGWNQISTPSPEQSPVKVEISLRL